MKTIYLNSLPINEVIEDIAHEFETDIHVNCDEYSLQIPPNIGEGKIWGINLQNGLGLIQYDCTFKEDTEIQFIVNKVHPLKFIYLIKGSIKHRFENREEIHHLENYQNVIVASSERNGHILEFKAGEHTQINSEELNRQLFQPFMDCELKSLPEDLENLFRDVEAKQMFYHKGYYTLQMASLFKKLLRFEDEGFLRKIFLEAISFRMLLTQILQYQDDISEENEKKFLKYHEAHQIKQAVELIENDVEHTPNIPELSQRVGLNVNKLQEGFKYLYKMTVNEYVTKTRMGLAKNLLENTSYNISEIGEKVGISSKSYFSKLFKETYGKSPSNFKMKTK